MGRRKSTILCLLKFLVCYSLHLIWDLMTIVCHFLVCEAVLNILDIIDIFHFHISRCQTVTLDKLSFLCIIRCSLCVFDSVFQHSVCLSEHLLILLYAHLLLERRISVYILGVWVFPIQPGHFFLYI